MKKRTGDLVREVSKALLQDAPWGRASNSRQTLVRMVVASVCKVNAQPPAPYPPLDQSLLEPGLPRERHRIGGDGRLQPDAGGLPVRPAGPLRLRPGAEDRRRREQRAQ